MKLFLVRHGEAEGHRTSDAERALTPRGWSQAREAGQWIAGQAATGSTLLLSSPYRRARETAAAINESLHWREARFDLLTPDDDPRRALAALQACSTGLDALVVVSHMPLVAALAHLLETGGSGAGQGFLLAEVRTFAMPDLMAGLGEKGPGFAPGIGSL